MDKHEGNRTPDFQNRNLMLYPLSYMLCGLTKRFREKIFIFQLIYKYLTYKLIYHNIKKQNLTRRKQKILII